MAVAEQVHATRARVCATFSCGKMTNLEEDSDSPGQFYCKPCWDEWEFLQKCGAHQVKHVWPPLPPSPAPIPVHLIVDPPPLPEESVLGSEQISPDSAAANLTAMQTRNFNVDSPGEKQLFKQFGAILAHDDTPTMRKHPPAKMQDGPLNAKKQCLRPLSPIEVNRQSPIEAARTGIQEMSIDKLTKNQRKNYRRNERRRLLSEQRLD